MELIMSNAPLVRERSRVQFSPAAPYFFNKYKVIKDGDLFGVDAEPCENMRVDSAKNWQAQYDGPETADFSPTSVYRVFDDAGDLLYVGASSQLWTRLYRHWYDVSAWRNDASLIYVETYPNRCIARAVESGAILSEVPLHNRRRLKETFGKRSMRGYVKCGEVLKSYLPFWLRVGADLRDLEPN